MHPGDERLLELAPLLCPSCPAGLRPAVEKLLALSGSAGADVAPAADELVDLVEAWLALPGPA